MKKNHFLGLIMLIGLMFQSFTVKTTVIKTQWYKTTCGDGRVYYFQCDCNLAQAQAISSLQCNPLPN